MVSRRPLVVVAGIPLELPTGDTLPGIAGSALPAVSIPADTDRLFGINAGATKTFTLPQVASYVVARNGVNNAAVTTPAAGFAGDAYLVGSSVAVPNGRLQPRSMYRLKFKVTKTAAGVVAPIVTVRLGTGGINTDLALVALTFAAQTAAVDRGFVEVFCTFLTTGAGTAATLNGVGTLAHALAATGLSTEATSIADTTSAGFNSTATGLILGASVNAGASAAWTISLVQAELFNLAP